MNPGIPVGYWEKMWISDPGNIEWYTWNNQRINLTHCFIILVCLTRDEFSCQRECTHWVKIKQDNFKTVNFETIFQSHCEVKSLSNNDFEMPV